MLTGYPESSVLRPRLHVITGLLVAPIPMLRTMNQRGYAHGMNPTGVWDTSSLGQPVFMVETGEARPLRPSADHSSTILTSK